MNPTLLLLVGISILVIAASLFIHADRLPPVPPEADPIEHNS